MRQIGAVLMIAFGLFCSAPGVAWSADNQAKAMDFFKSADARFEKGDYSAARRLYQRAHQLYPDVNILYMVGRCHELDRDFVAAQKVYRRVLKAKDVPKKVHDRATEGLRFLDRLHPSQYRLQLSVNTPATFELDGKTVGEGAALSLQVAPGEHRLRVSADGHVPFERTVSIGAEMDLFLNLAITGGGPGPAANVTTGWIALGAGSALLVTSGLMFMDAVDKAGEADDARKAGNEAAHTNAKSRAEVERALATVGAGLGLAAIAGGVYLLFFDTEGVLAERPPNALPGSLVWRW